jgi:hypothetical protein
MTGVIDYGYNFNYDDDLQLLVNRVYTATAKNEITLDTLINYGNWIECQWTTTPRKNTTDFKRELIIQFNCKLFKYVRNDFVIVISLPR